MRTVLGVSFIVLFAWVSALAIPRSAGAEYSLHVAWATHRGSAGLATRGDSIPYSAHRGTDSIVFIGSDDWSYLRSVPRQEWALASGDAYLNQNRDEDVFTFRRTPTEESMFPGDLRVPGEGIPRLYQSVAARFETSEIHFQRIPGSRVVRIPNSPTYTALHAAPMDHNPEGLVVIIGDMFGNVRGVAQDAQFGTHREFKYFPTEPERTIPTIYSVHILSAEQEMVDFFVVRGYDQARIELYRWHLDRAGESAIDVLYQREVPPVHSMRFAVPIRSDSSRWLAMGLRDGVFLYDRDHGHGVIQRLSHTPEWVAMGTAVGETQLFASFGRGNGRIELFEDVGSEITSRAVWVLLQAYPLSGDDRGVVIEQNDWYLALEVNR